MPLSCSLQDRATRDTRPRAAPARMLGWSAGSDGGSVRGTGGWAPRPPLRDVEDGAHGVRDGGGAPHGSMDRQPRRREDRRRRLRLRRSGAPPSPRSPADTCPVGSDKASRDRTKTSSNTIRVASDTTKASSSTTKASSSTTRALSRTTKVSSTPTKAPSDSIKASSTPTKVPRTRQSHSTPDRGSKSSMEIHPSNQLRDPPLRPPSACAHGEPRTYPPAVPPAAPGSSPRIQPSRRVDRAFRLRSNFTSPPE